MNRASIFGFMLAIGLPIAAAAEVKHVDNPSDLEIELNARATVCIEELKGVKSLAKIEKELELNQLGKDAQELKLNFEEAGIDESRQFLADRCLLSVAREIAALSVDGALENSSASTSNTIYLGEGRDLAALFADIP